MNNCEEYQVGYEFDKERILIMSYKEEIENFSYGVIHNSAIELDPFKENGFVIASLSNTCMMSRA